MAVTGKESKLSELIHRLDEAVRADQDSTCLSNVKTVLEDVVRSGQDFLEPRFLEPHPARYARRLLHQDANNAYTVLAMVWGQGQGAPLHDHAGHWCCECVYRGRIRVVQFELLNDPADEVLRFEAKGEVFAGVGEAGALIPPFEYHSIENVDATPAVTIHVYAGELTWCHSFQPVEGGYRMARRELSYTE
jgi:predicted metal-dependent enzyme (double-stranded beta helix superfamily)